MGESPQGLLELQEELEAARSRIHELEQLLASPLKKSPPPSQSPGQNAKDAQIIGPWTERVPFAVAVVTGFENIITFVNESFERAFSASMRPLEGQSFTTIFPKHSKAIADRLSESRASGTTFQLREIEIKGDSTVTWWNLDFVPRVPSPNEVCILVFGRDVTHLRKEREQHQETEQLLSMVFEQAATGIFLGDCNGRYLKVNNKFCEMVGYTAEELASKTFHDITHPDDLDGDKTKLNDIACNQNNTLMATKRYIRKDGKIIYAQRSASRMLAPDGSLLCILGIVVDITDQIKAEKELQESAALYQSVVKDQTEVISRFKPDGTFTFVNDIYCRYFGIPREQLLGHTWRQRALPEAVPEIDRKLLGLTPENPVIVIDNQVRDASGDVRWMQFANRGHFDAVGHLREIQSVGRDITDRVVAEKALKASEMKARQEAAVLDATLDSIAEGLIILDNGRKVVRLNTLSKHYFPYLSEGTRLWEGSIPPGLRITDVEGKEVSLGNIPGFRALGGATIMGSVLHIHGEGLQDRWISVNASPIQDQRGGVTGSIVTIQDVSVIKRNEKALVLAKEAAESSTRAKSEFLASMSHEIRTPLNGVQGMLQLLQTTDLDKEQEGYVRAAAQSAFQLNKLLSDILELSRVESGRLTLAEESFSFDDLKESTLDVFSNAANAKGLALRFTMHPRLPTAMRGDPVRLRQILFNLVGNSIKYTHQGGIDIHVTPASEPSPEGCLVSFTVEDTGIGIAAHLVDKVFEPFTQASPGSINEKMGVGLGLAIVKKLADLMRGTAEVMSEAGKGTTMRVTVPLANAKPGSGTADEPPLEAPVGPLRILLAEDDSVSQVIAKRMLEKAGHTVSVAVEGNAVLNALREGEFDLVLMDVLMPGMDGLETTRRIRGSAELASKSAIPIIAQTAYAMVGDRERILAAGMNDYVSKPVDGKALTAVIARVMAQCSDSKNSQTAAS